MSIDTNFAPRFTVLVSLSITDHVHTEYQVADRNGDIEERNREIITYVEELLGHLRPEDIRRFVGSVCRFVFQGDDCPIDLPSVSWGKQREHQHICLVPDLYYARERGYEAFLPDQVVPWQERSDRALWRGATTGDYPLTITTIETLPRFRLCKLGKAIAQPTDFAFYSVAQAASPADAEAIERKLRSEGLWAPYVPMQDFQKCKFIVQTDGNVNSWGLLKKLRCGACLVIVDSPWLVSVSDRLRPWEHFVPVRGDLSDLADKLDWCRSHDAESAAIAANGRTFARGMDFAAEMRQAAGDVLSWLTRTAQRGAASPLQRPSAEPAPMGGPPAVRSPRGAMHQRSKLVAFVGDCQAGALAHLYARFVCPFTGEHVRAIMVDKLQPGDREALSNAPKVAAQIFSMEKSLDATKEARAKTLVRFPALFAGFLWPFSGQQPRPGSFPVPELDNAPAYDGQIGDLFLNRLIEEGVSPEEALHRYLDLDIVRRANVDRLMELHLEAQTLRDEKTEFRFAETIADRFRDTPLFLTPHHPRLVLFSSLISGVFAQLGVPHALTDIALGVLREAPFPRTETPIHPRLIEHFGLSFVSAESGYQYLAEGRYTFSDYVRRYMTDRWNRPLARGLAQARAGEDAYPMLMSGLRGTPGSASGWRSLSAVLRNRGDVAMAREAAQTALRLDPNEDYNYLELARVLLAEGDLPGAERAVHNALALFSGDGEAQLVLADILVAKQDRAQAREALRTAAVQRPDDAPLHARLGMLASELGDPDGAELALRHALRLSPHRHGWQFFLGQFLYAQGRNHEALDIARQLANGDRRDDAHIHALVGHIQAALGDLEPAEAAFTKAVEIDPDFTAFAAALDNVRHHRRAQAL